MRTPRLRSAAVIAAAAIGLGGCATYSPFGYGSGVSVSYGDRGYYDPYYGGYSRYGHGSRYGYGYGSPYGYGYMPYYGWHNGFYYPGTGYYVYDRHRRPRQLSAEERRYWEQRASKPGSTLTRKLLDNWSGFSTGGEAAAGSTQSIDRERTVRVRRSGEARAPRQVQSAQGTRQSVRSERRVTSERAAARSERRAARSERREARSSAADDE